MICLCGELLIDDNTCFGCSNPAKQPGLIEITTFHKTNSVEIIEIINEHDENEEELFI